MCRVCLSGANKAWVSPCGCKGSMQWIHAECLDRQRQYSPHADHCTICNQAFPPRPRPPYARPPARVYLLFILIWCAFFLATLWVVCWWVYGSTPMNIILGLYYHHRHDGTDNLFSRECAGWPDISRHARGGLKPRGCLGTISPLVSTDGSHTLLVTIGGVIAIYNRHNGQHIIMAPPSGITETWTPRVLVMQTDGNLVLYNVHDGIPVWATNTSDSPGADLTFDSDRLEIRPIACKHRHCAKWTSSTEWVRAQ
jgi:hypothetical protein